MLDFLQIILAFLFTIGILVTVHEWGHYWVAKRLGVKILCFSIGFGQPLLSRRFGKDQTEFMVAAIPLGGYVKMLDEAEGEVAPEEAHRAFNRQPLWVRSAVVVAGPLVNFIFAILAYTLMFMIGVAGTRPIVGEVLPNTPAAQAGMQSGYEIIAVNGQNTLRWESVFHETLQAVVDKSATQYQVRNEQGYEWALNLDLSHLSPDDFSQQGLLNKLGMKPYRPTVPAVIGRVLEDSPAQQGGLQSGDKILSVNGKTIDNWHDWAEEISLHPEQRIEVELERQNKIINLMLVPANENGSGKLGIGAEIPENWHQHYYSVERYGFFSAFIQGLNKTWEYSILTLKMLGKMLTLEVSPKNISGPITIAEFAGHSFDLGWSRFLFFLALVSISLGIINLLPIPLLDGGHLLFYLLEWIKGSPLSETTLLIMQKLGITIVLLLMSLALFNDFSRLLG